MKLVIGNKNLSSWSLRPWLLMKQAGVAFEEHAMLFEDAGWPEKIAALSPSGLVPVLHDGAVVIWESLAIAEYVAELHPEMWPADRASRARARAVSAEMHSGFPNVRRELSMDVRARFAARPFSTETTREIARIRELWRECLEASGGPFLFGAFSVADAMYAPMAFRFRTYGVELDPYAQRLLELPAMKEWEAAAELEPETRV